MSPQALQRPLPSLARPVKGRPSAAGGSGLGCSARRRQGCRRRVAPPPAAASEDESAGSSSAPEYAVVLECDGVLLDAHGSGHRVAFNRAFEQLGYECVNWTEHIYFDLLRMGDGTGEGLIRAYYEVRGWPQFLPTNERATFVGKVHGLKVKLLREMAERGEVPLRPGVKEFMDDALAAGVQLAVVAGTASAPDDHLVSSAMLELGPARAMRLPVVTVGADASGSGAGDEGGEPPEPPPQSFEQSVAAAQARSKSTAAQSFTRAMNLQKASGLGLRVDPKLLAAAERAGLITPQLIAAIVAAMGVPAASTALLAANSTIMEAAKPVGLLVGAVPNSLASRGGYPAQDMAFDGFGPGGGVTWRKLKAILDSRRERQQQQGQQQR